MKFPFVLPKIPQNPKYHQYDADYLEEHSI